MQKDRVRLNMRVGMRAVNGRLTPDSPLSRKGKKKTLTVSVFCDKVSDAAKRAKRPRRGIERGRWQMQSPLLSVKMLTSMRPFVLSPLLTDGCCLASAPRGGMRLRGT
jgi:hypothetical protein